MLDCFIDSIYFLKKTVEPVYKGNSREPEKFFFIK